MTILSNVSVLLTSMPGLMDYLGLIAIFAGIASAVVATVAYAVVFVVRRRRGRDVGFPTWLWMFFLLFGGIMALALLFLAL